MKKGGQPSTYTPATGAVICARLSKGESLLKITEDMGIPYATARLWEVDIPEHAANSVRAREIGCHALADQMLQIADEQEVGSEITTKADGTTETKEFDMLGHRRLRIETRMRLLGKWLPKVYGDKQHIEHSGEIGIADRLKRAEERRK